MKSKVKTRTVIILFIIIALALTRLIYVFTVQKSGMHSDEIWSYGLANSNYEPYIYCDDNREAYKNFNEWISGDVFKNYITVQNEEKFSYGSVLYNQSCDDHPPLYYLLLHTICSFFPNAYSLWYGFVINIVAFILMMIFAFRLAKLMTNSDFFALSFTAFFAFCDGVLNMFEFVRMYALSTAVFTAILFYVLRLMKTKDIKRNVPILAFLIFFGSLTHYYFVIAAGVLTFLASIYFLIKKKIKVFLINGFSLLGGVLLSVAVFPATYAHLFMYAPNTSAETVPLPYNFSVKSCFKFCLAELFGIEISAYQTMTIDYIFVAVVLLLAVLVPIGFLLRKNEWVKKNVFGLPKRIWTFLKTHSKTSLAFAVMCLFTALSLILVVAKMVNVIDMELHTDRYLFVMYPAMAIAFCYVIFEVLIHIIKKHKWISKSMFCVILAVFVAVGTWRIGCIYLFERKDDDVHLSEVTENSDVVLALTREWTLTCFPQELMNTNKVFVTSFNNIEDDASEIKNKIDLLDSDKPLYLAINTDSLYENYNKYENTGDLAYIRYGHDKDKMLNFFKSLDVAEKFEYVGHDTIFDDTVTVYKLRD